MIAASRCLALLACALLVYAALGSSPAAAQDESALSVAEFVRQQPKWQRMQGTTLRVEGRCPIIADERLFFTNCDLLFVLAEGVRAPMVRSKTVQVTGKLETRQGKLTFIVSRLKELPTDAETLADRRARLPTDDANAWYKLAEWSEQRGRFYDDSHLIDGATQLRRSGIQIEYRQIPVGDIPALYVLAEKAAKFDLPAALRDEIVHDALRRELRQLRPREPRQWDVVLTNLLKRLPGSEVSLGFPISAEAQALEREYLEQPLEVYEKTDPGQRRLLHRWIYARTQLQRFEMDAADDGSNGFRIAARIEQTLPEFKDRADAYREREINWQLDHVPDLDRDGLLELTSRLEERDRASRAAEARRTWLAAQEPKFRERGAGGLLDYAQEHIDLLSDPEAAADIYRELYQDRLAQETARARLVDMGYAFDGSRWVKQVDIPPDDTADAIRRGIVRKGMTSEQVRNAFGKPVSVVKFAVRGQVSELWVYPDHGVSIEFARRGADAESIAVQVSAFAAQ